MPTDSDLSSFRGACAFGAFFVVFMASFVWHIGTGLVVLARLWIERKTGDYFDGPSEAWLAFGRYSHNFVADMILNIGVACACAGVAYLAAPLFDTKNAPPAPGAHDKNK
jgi:hypothetical protein